MRQLLPAPIFWLGYFALMLILLLLGETFLGLYVMVIITIFVQIGLTGRRQTPSHPWYKVSVGLSFLFFVWLAISTIFSISLPLSLQTVFEWVFLINLFFWFLEVPWDDIDRRFWLLGMLMMGVILVVLGGLALVFPQYSTLVPGMNLIYPTYGHNHLGVILLLVMPMFWAAAKEWPSKLTQWLAVGFSFTPLITFGRMIVFLSLAQLVFTHFKYVKEHVWSRWLTGIAISAAVLVLCTQLFLGWYIDQTQVCPFPRFRNQLCKSWKEEKRLIYLSQAWEGFKQRPWTGSGPGTFGLISDQHRQLPSASSGFVHNDYAQFFVEYGAAGGLMLCLGLGWLLYRLRPTSKKTKNDHLYRGIYTGLLFVAINSFFDFDFNFIGVLALELMGLALLSKWDTVTAWPAPLTLFEVIIRWWRRWFHTAALVVLLLVSLLYAGTNLLLDLGKTEIVAKWFPYIPWQSKIIFSQMNKLPLPAQQKVHEVYWHHASLLNEVTGPIAATATEAARLGNLFVIDPWARLHKERYSYYLNQGDFRQAEQELGAANNFFQTKMAHGFGRENIPNGTKESLAKHMMWLADRQFQQARFAEGVESMVAAQSYEDWIFNQSEYCNSLPLLYTNYGDDPMEFLQPLTKVPKQFFGQCRPDFANFYLKLYEQQLATGECAEHCKFYFAQALGYEDWVTNIFWEKFFYLHVGFLRKAIEIQDAEWAIRQWRETVANIRAIDTYEYREQDASRYDGQTERKVLLQLQREIEPHLAGLGQDTEQKLRQELRDDARWLYATSN